jgi:hypothetical protein
LAELVSAIADLDTSSRGGEGRLQTVDVEHLALALLEKEGGLVPHRGFA